MMQPATGVFKGSVQLLAPSHWFLVSSWATSHGQRGASPKKAGVLTSKEISQTKNYFLDSDLE